MRDFAFCRDPCGEIIEKAGGKSIGLPPAKDAEGCFSATVAGRMDPGP